ncbi:MAG: hypothetical protein QOH48_132 [Actinomycetota bacterium]|jgi:hypothetical protein|nr:hypothetical protein [Actinomycetota bacterium]
MSAKKLVAGLSAAVLCCLTAGVAAASPAPRASVTVSTVVTGLDNPRDLAFGRNGKLYVAEAGHGGTHCLSGGPNGMTCYGFTSGISRINISHHHARRIVSGLVSTAAQDGTFATGVDGISRRHHNIFGIITGAPDAVPAGSFGAPFRSRIKAELGRLIRVSSDGTWRRIASVGHRDYIWSGNHTSLVPGQFPDANPYGVLAQRHAQWVVDAASNTLDRVGRHGRVHVLQFIPNPPSSDSVPTCVVRGPDGALYIGELTGGGNAPGASSVWRYSRRTGNLTLWATGLTAVTGCGFHRDHFYATEFSTNGLDNAAPGTGAVVRVPANSSSPVTVVSGLNFPGGFAARQHSLFVSNWSVRPTSQGGGEVTRILLGS